MRAIPAFTHRLPNRRAGSFGTSPVGRAAEWLTYSWLRFEAFLTWLILLALFSAMEWQSPLAFLSAIVGSPVLAVFTVFTLKVMGWMFYFIVGAGNLWAWGRIAFLSTFSRLVIEHAPEIELPAWKNH